MAASPWWRATAGVPSTRAMLEETAPRFPIGSGVVWAMPMRPGARGVACRTTWGGVCNCRSGAGRSAGASPPMSLESELRQR
ncbi:hypothetical protein E2562_018056 [Oryza meyeriana var. granulata]|uniref:Uncharacterized protein n=1 Tax=Oryza meyeriana var. granulata TaxID=110450 RepID=A0A6G1CR31_9ORYZ|nr:hypothetical protein E2562_018056 [Oryza meyeriana var. granulata]